MATPATTPGPKRTWSDLSRGQKMAYAAALIILPGAFGIGLLFFLSWAFPSSEPVSAKEKQQRDEDKTIAKNIERLEKDVGKKLRPGRNIVVDAGHRHDGVYFILAEYKPLRLDSDPIEDDMLEAYKAAYTSRLPVINVQITAFADLVDRYGNQVTDVVYVTEMKRDMGERINWENLRSVNPSRVMDINYRHPSVR